MKCCFFAVHIYHLSFYNHMATVLTLLLSTREEFMLTFRAYRCHDWIVFHVCTCNWLLPFVCFILILVWMHGFSL